MKQGIDARRPPPRQEQDSQVEAGGLEWEARPRNRRRSQKGPLMLLIVGVCRGEPWAEPRTDS